jgi:hypothetical protein
VSVLLCEELVEIAWLVDENTNAAAVLAIHFSAWLSATPFLLLMFPRAA